MIVCFYEKQSEELKSEMESELNNSYEVVNFKLKTFNIGD